MFSILIPVYNHAKYVQQAVASALRSPLVREILLIDDGSTDASSALISEFAAAHPARVRNLTPPTGGNRGAHYRLNQLVDAARCEWIAILNSDDVFVDGRLEAVAAHALFPHSDFVFGNLLLMDDRGNSIGAKRGPFDTGTPFPSSFNVAQMVNDGDFLDLLSHQNYLGTTSNMIFKKSLHTRVGGFKHYRYVHDWDFAMRAMALGRPFYLQRYLTAYRMHPGNTILENAARVSVETKEVFEHFCGDLPEIAQRPAFQVGMTSNVNLIVPAAEAAPA